MLSDFETRFHFVHRIQYQNTFVHRTSSFLRTWSYRLKHVQCSCLATFFSTGNSTEWCTVANRCWTTITATICLIKKYLDSKECCQLNWRRFIWTAIICFGAPSKRISRVPMAVHLKKLFISISRPSLQQHLRRAKKSPRRKSNISISRAWLNRNPNYEICNLSYRELPRFFFKKKAQFQPLSQCNVYCCTDLRKHW